MAPVDLAHTERLEKALNTAADIANLYSAKVVYVGVTNPEPSTVAHTPEEFEAKLKAFAAEQGSRHGHATSAHSAMAHDTSIDVDDALLAAVDATGADLVVMASHVPGLMDYVWPSNGGKIAAHAKTSVFVVRPA